MATLVFGNIASYMVYMAPIAHLGAHTMAPFQRECLSVTHAMYAHV